MIILMSYYCLFYYLNKLQIINKQTDMKCHTKEFE